MKQILTKIMCILAITFAPVVWSMPAYAASPPPSCGDSNSAKGQVLQGIGQTGSDCNDGAINSVLNTAVNILSIIVGAAAIIMIIAAGFKYVVSGGDSSKVGSAKSTLIYALVGVVIAALAQVLVRYVIAKSAS